MKGFAATDNPSHEGKTNQWLTPLPLIKALGRFDLDPCGFIGHPTADQVYVNHWFSPQGKTKSIYKPYCGLGAKWRGRVWLNPPYGKSTGRWLEKLEKHGDGIALVFNRTETHWFQDLNPDLVLFVRGRISFLNSEFKTVTNAGTGSMLLAWGVYNVHMLKRSGIPGKLGRLV